MTADLVEMRSRERAASRPRPRHLGQRTPSRRLRCPARFGGPASRPDRAVRARPVAPVARRRRGRVLGDEKKILMILCTRVKQEAETAIGESNLPGIDRPYKQALAEIDRGRGVEAVRDLIRQTEKAISSHPRTRRS